MQIKIEDYLFKTIADYFILNKREKWREEFIKEELYNKIIKMKKHNDYKKNTPP